MRLLLVEDDALLGDGIHAGLKLADHAVDWVRDGEAAHLALLDHEYDACVLDLGLPDIDGRQVCADLKRNPATSSIPIVVVTAKSGDVERILTRVTGADAFLAKPFHLQELTDKVREVLAIRRPA